MVFLLEDLFDVKDIDTDGKKFDNVSRIQATSQTYNLDLTLDVNTEIYPMKVDDRFSMALTNVLRKDGEPDDGCFDQSGFDSHADDFEYVMYGKVFKHHSKPNETDMSVFVSFGGLLMHLRGDESNLSKLDLDSRIYILIRKN
ncbi:RNA polymerase [Baffinella frigidus]|nr:RNA polymerase [Cryptophyta sp. CCMP2293]|mmetsp:Transcript_32831/g.77816  ORF Transcript_32831/g.77816 Transcript_32831/m.77816 type:complete len:143 (+) Transcript_32831:228-656(+)